MATQIKPKTSGSFTTITTTSTGLVTKTATGISSATSLGNALLAINMWHNAPGNATTSARAAKIASAAGLSLQEV